MNWSDVGSIVTKSAPYIGGLLGGPAGAAVGALIANELGVKNDPDSINSAILASPDAIARIKEVEINAKIQLQQLAVQMVQVDTAQYVAEAADRDSARTLATAQPNDMVRPTLTFVMLAGSLFIVGAILLGVATEVLKDPIVAATAGTILGVWLSMTKDTIAFWFGMTKESQKQNAIVTEFAVKPGTVKNDQ